MTNKEILQANMLDILFENRNKAYGAYALRKDYNHRMQWALGSCLGLALLLVMINFMKGGDQKNPFNNDNNVVTLTSVDIPKEEKPKEIEKPKTQPKTAQTQYTNQIQLVKENVKINTPDINDLKNTQISDKTVIGDPTDGTLQKIPESSAGDGNKNTVQPEPEKPMLPSSEAKFPGGVSAFTEFLKRYLVTPEELQLDEKKTVLVRFMVDVDGSISKAEIIQSGSSFDKEVLRVLRKMPKWVPAQQSGMKVSSYFTQSVTFIGVEQ